MQNQRIAALALLLLFAGVVAIYRWRRYAENRRTAEQTRKKNREFQDYVIAQLDVVGKIVERTDLSAAEIEAQSEAVIAELQARSVDDVLEPLIADTRLFVQEQLEKRANPIQPNGQTAE